MGAGILPIALYRGSLFILLGQERNNKLWSDFGGSRNKNEKPFDTAIREGGEELNGLFGLEDNLKECVTNNMITSMSYDKYTSYLFQIKYDKQFPDYFNNLNSFSEKYLKDKIDNNHNGLFEKCQVQWFDVKSFKIKDKNIIRPHYMPIVSSIIKNEKFIISQIKNSDNADLIHFNIVKE